MRIACMRARVRRMKCVSLGYPLPRGWGRPPTCKAGCEWSLIAKRHRAARARRCASAHGNRCGRASAKGSVRACWCACCCSVPAITLILTVLQLYLDYRRDVGVIKDRLAEIERSYIESIGESLWQLDERQLVLQLEGILRLPDIRAVEVREATNRPAPLVVAVGERQSNAALVREIPIMYSVRGSRAADRFALCRGDAGRGLPRAAGQGAGDPGQPGRQDVPGVLVHRLHLSPAGDAAPDRDRRDPAVVRSAAAAAAAPAAAPAATQAGRARPAGRGLQWRLGAPAACLRRSARREFPAGRGSARPPPDRGRLARERAALPRLRGDGIRLVLGDRPRPPLHLSLRSGQGFRRRHRRHDRPSTVGCGDRPAG